MGLGEPMGRVRDSYWQPPSYCSSSSLGKLSTDKPELQLVDPVEFVESLDGVAALDFTDEDDEGRRPRLTAGCKRSWKPVPT